MNSNLDIVVYSWRHWLTNPLKKKYRCATAYGWFFLKIISRGEKEDILNTIEDYRKGLVPLIVPVTLIRHQVKKYNIEYLLDQIYLNPHPKELMLRNHV